MSSYKVISSNHKLHMRRQKPRATILNFGPKLLPFGNKKLTLVMTGRSGITVEKAIFCRLLHVINA